MTTFSHGRSGEHATSPRPPQQAVTVGPYTLLTKIGEGGMGVVHLARAPHGERVALKVLRPHIVGDDEARARLAREVGSLSRIRSRWVAEIKDADPWAVVPYVATRYVPGLSLHDHVVEEGRVEGEDLVWFAACLAEGLDSVHAVGVLHRDVKPSNVLMEGRTPILIDFGLARVADDPKLTHTGWLLGTPGYLAPEILYGDDATTASDVHSWGATVAYAGLGRAPFGRGPSMAIMDRVRRGEHDLSGLDGDLAQVVAAALHPDPARRPTLAELLAWLRPQTTRPETAPAPLPPPAREDPFTLPLALAAEAVAQRLGHPTGPGTDAGAHRAADADAAADPATDVLADPASVRDDPAVADPRVDPWADPWAGPAGDRQGAAYDGRGPDGTLVERDHPPTRVYEEDPTRRLGDPDPWSTPRPEAGPGDPAVAHPGGRPEGHDPDGPEGPGDPWAHEPWGAPVEVARAPLTERARRATLLVAAAGAVGTATAAAPWVTLAVLLVLVTVLRGGSLAGSVAADRRRARGPKWYDGPRLLLAAPWTLTRSLPATAVLTLWSVGLGLAVALLCYAVAATTPTILLVSGATVAVSLWAGPGGSRVRSPLARVVEPAARSGARWVVSLVVLVLLAAAGAFAQAQGGTRWTPDDSPPLADVSLPSWWAAG